MADNELVFQHRVTTEWPFPVAGPCRHYFRVRSWSAATDGYCGAVERVCRYLAIVMACDYFSGPSIDPKYLDSIRTHWLDGNRGGFAFGNWVAPIDQLLGEIGGSWQEPFLTELPDRATELHDILDKQVRPVVAEIRNPKVHREAMSNLRMTNLLNSYRQNLRNFLEAADFLAGYSLCFVTPDNAAAEPDRNGRYHSMVTLCRGHSPDFLSFPAQTPEPLAPCVPFLWSPDFERALSLAPFFLVAGHGESGSDSAHGLPYSLAVLSKPDPKRQFRRANYDCLFTGEPLQAECFPHFSEGWIAQQLETAFRTAGEHPKRQRLPLLRTGAGTPKDDLGELADGTVLTGWRGEYVIHGCPVGRGGMSVVYLGEAATGTAVGNRVAIKVTPPGEIGMADRLKAEGSVMLALAATDNDHLVKAFDHGQLDGRHFIAMEYVAGGSLEEELARRQDAGRGLAYTEVLAIMEQLSDGLQAMHQAGYIHRDMKPQNVVLEFTEKLDEGLAATTAKITDFGLAKRLEEDGESLPPELKDLGTYEYMAPEQFADFGTPAGRAADIYALAKIMTLLLSGQVPAAADELDDLDLTAALRVEDAVTVPAEGLRQILTCALAPRPEERFESIGDFREAVAQAGEVEAGARRLAVTAPEAAARADIRATFALAQVGIGAARERLLRWACSTDERNVAAALAADALGAEARAELIRRAAVAVESEPGSSTAEACTQVLSALLRWHEIHRPRLRGQQWVQRLPDNVRRPVLRTYHGRARRQFRATALPVYFVYAGFGALGGALGVLFDAAVGIQHVYWRTDAPDTAAWVRLFEYGFIFMLTGVYWAGPMGLAMHLARLYERPRRWIVLAVGATIALLVGGGGMVGFSVTMGKGSLLDAAGGPEQVTWLLGRYFALVSLLVWLIMVAYAVTAAWLLLNSRRMPAVPGGLAFALATLLLCWLPPLLLGFGTFTGAELLGTAVIAATTMLGFVLADRREHRHSSATRGVMPCK